MNVLLTRCRLGMVIVTDRAFVQGAGQNILLAHLERHMRSRFWVSWRDVANGTAELPGFSKRRGNG
ncbi:hypothetical protein BD626DRAFT_371025, partial [Schizophyllum amplum]